MLIQENQISILTTYDSWIPRHKDGLYRLVSPWWLYKSGPSRIAVVFFEMIQLCRYLTPWYLTDCYTYKQESHPNRVFTCKTSHQPELECHDINGEVTGNHVAKSYMLNRDDWYMHQWAGKSKSLSTLTPNHYQNQCRLIGSWTLRKKTWWKFESK